MKSFHEKSGDHDARFVLLIKGKRTKRHRSASPLMNVPALSSVSLPETREEIVKKDTEAAGEVEFRGVTDEDEDMANCLILLSQGYKSSKSSGDQFSTRKMGFLPDKKPMGSLGLGLDGVHHCRTCDKSFHSFQALGGHRASHKRHKLEQNVLKSSSAVETILEETGDVRSFLSLQVTSNDVSKKLGKRHECSICKAEFPSGQALGGHMRRHRGLTLNANANADAISTIKTTRPPQNFLELDLNLPAPAPEDEPKFGFGSKDKILSFVGTSNSSLINCHH